MPSDQEKTWLRAWRFAGPRLEEIRRRELREMDEKQGLRWLGAKPASQTPTATSGLIEFQWWMMRLRNRQGSGGARQ